MRDLPALLAKLKGQFAGSEFRRTNGGVDGHAAQGIEVGFGQILNLHPAMGRGDDHDPLKLSVQHKAQIHFLFDVGGTFHPDAVDALAVGIGSLGNQLFFKQSFGKGLELVRSAAEFYAARSAPAAGVDLGFDHSSRSAQFTGAKACLFRAVDQPAAWHRHAETGEDMSIFALFGAC